MAFEKQEKLPQEKETVKLKKAKAKNEITEGEKALQETSRAVLRNLSDKEVENAKDVARKAEEKRQGYPEMRIDR